MRTSALSGRGRGTEVLRDGFWGLDYADQRFQASGYEWFATTDVAPSNFSPDPKSFNRYEYVGDDPVNRNDPRGQSW